MSQFTRRKFVVATTAGTGLVIASRLFGQTSEDSAFQFNGTNYYFRWTDGKLFEFTPQGQTDLEKYSDMVSVLVVPGVKTPEDLRDLANAVLEDYKNNGAVIKATSTPTVPEKPTEYFAAAMLAAKGVAEGTFARFLLHEGIGYNLLYAHKIYGPVEHDNGAALGIWEKQNGSVMEDALMKFTSIPSTDMLQRWAKVTGSK